MGVDFIFRIRLRVQPPVFQTDVTPCAGTKKIVIRARKMESLIGNEFRPRDLVSINIATTSLVNFIPVYLFKLRYALGQKYALFA